MSESVSMLVIISVISCSMHLCGTRGVVGPLARFVSRIINLNTDYFWEQSIAVMYDLDYEPGHIL